MVPGMGEGTFNLITWESHPRAHYNSAVWPKKTLILQFLLLLAVQYNTTKKLALVYLV